MADLRLRSAPSIDARCAALAAEQHLVLLLDLDGTLIPFAPRTEDANLDREAAHILDGLHSAGVQVVVVSGRPQPLLAPQQSASPHTWWVAEHGAWRSDEPGRWIGPAQGADLSDLIPLLEQLACYPGARIERKTLSVCLHWRLVPTALKDELIRTAALICDEWLETRPDFERIPGVEMLEVRRRSAHKGAAVAWVRERLPTARFIAIGDDETDEDMFAALHPDELAIGVGPRPSARSAYRLANVDTVRRFLRWIAELRTTGAAPFEGLEPQPPIAPPRARLLVVSNRTPPTTTGKQRNVGGLVSALEPALRDHGGIWLGWSGHDSEGAHPVMIDRDSRPIRASFDLSPAWREHFYGGFCNRALWPLFHGFPGRVSYTDVDWHAYVDANAEFARHASELVSADGTIWVHDYHLLLAGQALRERGFRGPLGMFLHIPFPAYDAFDTLPWADDLIEAMCAFDLVGFHTPQWAGNFRDCARKLRPTGRALPEIAILPIGVDGSEFAPGTHPDDPEVIGLKAALGQRRLVLGVDRLDYAKGIPERLLAFECLLEIAPEWRGQISFVQISVPSREDVPEYADLRRRVEMLVGRINGRFGEADWVPVRYLYRSYDHAVLAQLYRAADVALVTPLRDGLNLVAKEFVVAQDPARPGVLVLSKFAGAATELGDAVITNPYHVDGLAADIDRALRMTAEERAQRYARMSAALAGKTPRSWAAAFLDRLVSATRRVA